MLQLIYDIHTVIAKTRLSFCAHTHRCNTVNWSIYWFSDRVTCVANIYITKTRHSLCSYTQNDSNVFAHTLQLIYITHTYIAKARLSFCTSTRLHNAVNRSIYWFSDRLTCVANTYTAKTWHSLCSYTQNNSNVFAHALQLIYITHIHIAKARLSFYASTRLRDAVNRSIFRFIRLIYMHRNHIHCKDMTQSLLIYTERQQRLCACAATNIRHSHSYCKGTTQLLRIYTSVQRSKLIDFNFLIDLHMLQYTQNDSNVFAYALQLIYITHTYTAKTWFSFCASTRLCDAVNQSIFRFSDWFTCVANT